MSTYSLTGSGVQPLTSGTTALHVSITTVPPIAGNGRATPTNYYDVALLRFGDPTGYFDAIPVVGGPQWMAVPNGCTRLGYTCLFNAAISVTEVIGGTPPFGGGGALASLSDVAVSSPADTQLLTYQASSGKWINANAPSGGGGSGIGTYRCAARKNTFSTLANNTTYLLSWDTSVLDTDTMLQVGGAHPNRITFPHAGTYLIEFAAQTTGGAGIALTMAKNTDAATFPAGNPDQSGGYPNGATLSTVQVNAANDYWSFYVYCGTGSGNYAGRVFAMSL